MAEAIRLIREALLSYAIDPLTGKIDMDLINTGKSGAIREKVTQIKNIILDILNKKSPSAEYSTLLADIKNIAGMVCIDDLCNRWLMRNGLKMRSRSFLMRRLFHSVEVFERGLEFANCKLNKMTHFKEVFLQGWI